MATRPDSLQSDRVAAEIRVLMARAGMSQKSLRSAIGMSAPTLSRKLKGEGAFTLPELFSIATALGVSASELLAAAEESAA